MDFLAPVLQRNVVIALAIFGALVATLGSHLVRKSEKGGSVDPKLARFILRTGYAITWASVGIFIIAGFAGPYMSDG